MAWQLIYTSAPRLLEAGRTGFGTVARHRAVGGGLAAMVERLSQFARLPGHDPKRVVLAHRIVESGGVEYHVLSCLRDAGSDYTGRTNHIAHHLIAEKEEVRALALAGISPADVLLTMPWRSAWTGTARFLDPADEVDLASLRAGPVGQNWGAVTGDQRFSRLPWTPAARGGCFLITPADAPVLDLLREALREMPAHAWQATFTTSLEPNDEVEDFRWICLSATSPLRAQADASARPVFDLTQPKSLILPQPPEQPRPAAAAEPAPAVPSVRVPRRVSPPAGSESWSQQEDLLFSQLDPESTSASPMGTWLPEPRGLPHSPAATVRGVPKQMLVAAAVVLVCAVLTGWFFYQRAARARETNELKQQIETIWQHQGLRLEDTKLWLTEMADVPAAHGRKLVHQHLVLLRDMENGLAGRPVPQTAVLPAELRADLKDLHATVMAWQMFEASQPAPSWNDQTTSFAMLSDVDSWRARRRQIWEAIQVHFMVAPPLPPDTASSQKLADRALRFLNQGTPPKGAAAEWRALLGKLGRGSDAPAWLEPWDELEKLPPGTAVKKISDTLAAMPDAPEWLKKDVEGIRMRQEQTAEPQIKAPKPTPAPPLPPPPEIEVENADAPDAMHSIIIVQAESSAALAEALHTEGLPLSALPLPREVQIYFGPLSQAASFVTRPGSNGKAGAHELKRWSAFPLSGERRSYAESFQSTSPGSTVDLELAGGRLHALPVSAAAGRLLGRGVDGAHVEFDVRFKTSTTDATEIITFFPTLTIPLRDPQGLHLPELGTLLRRLLIFKVKESGGKRGFQAVFKPQFELMENTPQASKGHKILLSDSSAGLAPPASPVQAPAAITQAQMELASLIKQTNEGIQSLQQHLGKLNMRVIGDAQKAAGYNRDIAQKQAELAILRGKMAAPPQASPPPVAPSIRPGEYILLEKSDSTTRLCKILLQQGSL